MKKTRNILITLFFLSVSIILQSEERADTKIVDTVQPTASKPMVSFKYNDEELVNVINYVASKKEVNLLLPTSANDKVTGKLTWHLEKKVTIDEAWNLLEMILRIAGYSFVHKPNHYEVVKLSPAISRESAPLYVGVAPDQLPLTDQRIRYIYYLVNIKSEGEGDNEIHTVLKALLPSNAVYKIDSATNALLIMAPATDVRSVMSVVTHLDRPGFQEQLEIIKLKYTNARMVSDMFNNKILQTNEMNRYRLDTKKTSDATYFSKHIKIISNERTNNLIVLGRPQSTERIREFIKHYIDVEPDSGKSILHIYPLQYLDAPSLAKVLDNIIQSKQTGGLEQATGEQRAPTGPQRYFDEVIIAVDSPADSGFDEMGTDESFGTVPEEDTTTEEETTTETTSPIKPVKYHGGNKLIIAARSDDWKRIKELIEKLDQPQPQVLIEVLIADLTLDDSRALGTLFRNPEKTPMPNEMNIQSAQLAPGVIPDSFNKPATIGVLESEDKAADVLRTYGIDSTGTRVDDGTLSVASQMIAGSTAISFSDNDGKTWGITQILKLIDHTKILSHPHVISTNNQPAKIENTEIRVLIDQASGSSGGSIVQTRKQVKASLKVNIIPRISLSDTREDTVNLQVTINIDEYKSTTNDTRITRNVTTNATVNTGDILAIGGLIRSNETDAVGETPVLSKIPILGWLFKKRSKTKQRTNLTVFISPTIIQPRLRAGIGEYTSDYLSITKEYAKSGDLFDSLKDPITRWFFAEESATERFTRDFMSKDETHSNNPPMPTHTRARRTKHASNNTKQDNSKRYAQQKKEQADHLKNLFSNTDNPFKNMKVAATAA